MKTTRLIVLIVLISLAILYYVAFVLYAEPQGDSHAKPAAIVQPKLTTKSQAEIISSEYFPDEGTCKFHFEQLIIKKFFPLST